MVGRLCVPKFRATNDGRPRASALSKAIKPIGTVPDFWEVEVIETGARVRVFVHEEDWVPVKPSHLVRIK